MHYKVNMQFTTLETEDQLQQIRQAKGVSVIFKHNTRCPISRGVKGQLEQEGDMIGNVEAVYLLDIHLHRDLSDAVAEQFDVEHESPQLLLIKNGACTYHKAHYEISAEATVEALNSKEALNDK
jgi:bacillithiol system protein YtxJ